MQLPLQFTIQGVPISIVGIGVFLFIIIYTYTYWVLSRDKMRPVQIFDTVVVNLLISLLMARLLSVLFHFDSYADNFWQVFNVFDKNYFYIGIFLGQLLGTFLIFNYSNREKDFREFIAKVIISYIYAIIPLLVCILLSGKMLGIEVNGGFAIANDGIMRMPVNIFRIAYNLIFLTLFLIFKGRKESHHVLLSMYVLVFALFEFILRFFSSGYSSYLFGAIDLQQFAATVIFIVGIIILFENSKTKQSYSFNRSIKGREDIPPRGQEFNYLRNNQTQTPQERFSLSYSKIQSTKTAGDLTPQERLRALQNTLKRKIMK